MQSFIKQENMKRYFIEEAKCGVSSSAMCGPAPCAVVAAVKFKEGSKDPKWLYLSEFDCIPSFFVLEEDIFDSLIEEDEETISRTNDILIDQFDGIDLGSGEYDFASLTENTENPAALLIRYIILLVRCDSEDVDGFITMARGKYVDELDIPMSDIEEEYLEEVEGDEE